MTFLCPNDKQSREDRIMIRRVGRDWRRLLRNASAGLLLAVAWLLCAPGAWAKSAAIAVYTEGADAAAVREMALAAVPTGPKVLDPSAFQAALAEQGQKGPFGKKLDGAAHDAAIRRVRAAATARNLDAVLLARVTRDKSKRRRVRMLLVETSGGETAVDDVWIASLDGDEGRTQMASALTPILQKYGERSAPEATAPAATPEAASAPAPAREAAEGASAGTPDAANPDSVSSRPHGLLVRSLFDVDVGAAASGRQFNYNDPITSNLRSYNVVAAMVVASGEVFPLTDAPGVLRDIGIVGGYGRSLPLESVVGQERITTTETSYYAGLRARIHPYGDMGTLIGVSDEFAGRSFTFAMTGSSIDGELPSVDYKANRTAVDVRIPLGRLAVLAGAGFRLVFDAGDVAARLRSPTVSGIDADLGVSFAVISGIEARLVGDYERYFFAFKPTPGDAFVAGGALDQFFGGRLAVAYIF